MNEWFSTVHRFVEEIGCPDPYANDLLLCFVPVLDVEAFERLMGPCMNVMKRNIDGYEDQLIRIFGSRMNMSDFR